MTALTSHLSKLTVIGFITGPKSWPKLTTLLSSKARVRMLRNGQLVNSWNLQKIAWYGLNVVVLVWDRDESDSGSLPLISINTNVQCGVTLPSAGPFTTLSSKIFLIVHSECHQSDLEYCSSVGRGGTELYWKRTWKFTTCIFGLYALMVIIN